MALQTRRRRRLSRHFRRLGTTYKWKYSQQLLQRRRVSKGSAGSMRFFSMLIVLSAISAALSDEYSLDDKEALCGKIACWW